MNAAATLDLFAAAWVERWLANGGSVTVCANGKSTLCAVVSPSDVPGYEPPSADLPESVRANRILFDDYTLCGRQRELIALLDSIHGGREAVKDHVRSFPSHFYGDGTRAVA